MADLFVLLAACALVVVGWATIRPIYDRRAEARFRQDSLRFDEVSGLFHWETSDGTRHSSDKHPTKPGGAWYETELEAVSHMNP